MNHQDDSNFSGNGNGNQWEPETVYQNTESESPRDLNIVLQQAQERLVQMQKKHEALRKRSDEECNRTILYATEALALQLLPILDNFDRVVQHMDTGSGGNRDVDAGIKMVHERLCKVLGDEGIHSFEDAGKRFNPTIHEAVQTREQSDTDPGTILEVYQKGYNFRGRLLRAAQVVISPLNPKREMTSETTTEVIEELEAEENEKETPQVIDEAGATQPEMKAIEGSDIEKSWVIDDNVLSDKEISSDSSHDDESKTYPELDPPEVP